MVGVVDSCGPVQTVEHRTQDGGHRAAVRQQLAAGCMLGLDAPDPRQQLPVEIAAAIGARYRA